VRSMSHSALGGFFLARVILWRLDLASRPCTPEAAGGRLPLWRKQATFMKLTSVL
jgi:hypothetical protein